ncbi:MAG: superoxide reductase [Candidatus Kentron sp. G]|nr:MAG: superoxide reductase [Candidatus Kentron sp. G]VFM98555.1 MAG: superoxide reductase [Candidatus Kentron sp. G]VFM99688.1 MAG: superoxide reductase [Candidatus Kentron sp. G]
MQRRDLIGLTLAGVGAGVLLPQTLSAGDSAHSGANPMAGGVFYTNEAQGRWSGKAATHLPQIQIDKGTEGVTVTVVTGHEIDGFEHYIVKHVLLDGNYAFIDEKMFDPSKETQAISSFSLGEYSGAVHALSVCNKHDTWLSTAQV